MAYGLIYIARNNCDPINTYKVGKTSKKIELRMKQLTRDTSNLGEYESVGSIVVSEISKVEKETHNRLSRYRIQSNREFFKCDLSTIVRTLRSVAIEYLIKDDLPKLDTEGELINLNEIFESEYSVTETLKKDSKERAEECLETVIKSQELNRNFAEKIRTFVNSNFISVTHLTTSDAEWCEAVEIVKSICENKKGYFVVDDLKHSPNLSNTTIVERKKIKPKILTVEFRSELQREKKTIESDIVEKSSTIEPYVRIEVFQDFHAVLNDANFAVLTPIFELVLSRIRTENARSLNTPQDKVLGQLNDINELHDAVARTVALNNLLNPTHKIFLEQYESYRGKKKYRTEDSRWDYKKFNISALEPFLDFEDDDEYSFLRLRDSWLN